MLSKMPKCVLTTLMNTSDPNVLQTFESLICDCYKERVVSDKG